MRSSNLWQGVVGFWSASAGPSGYRLLDRSGRNNHGTLTNMDAATDWVVDGGRYALDFDGADAAEATPGNQNRISISRDLASSSLGISMWVYPQSNDKRGLCTSAPILNNPSFAITMLTNRQLETYRGANTNSTLSLTLNDWNHFIVYNDGVTTTYYINGKFSNSVAQSILIANQAEFYFGYNYWGAFNGLIAEVVAYSRLPSASEAAQLYQIGRGGMLTPRRRRRAYSVATGLRRRLLLTGQV